MSTGPQFNTYIIPDVSLGDTFQEWRNITNNDIIDKLNRLKVYTGLSADGISVGIDTAGNMYVEHSGYVAKGVTFGGDITILGQITTVHSNNVTINDYNLVLGSTSEDGSGGTNDAGISAQGGGGIIISRVDGSSAEFLWFPIPICGSTGAWTTNQHLKFDNGKGLVVEENGTLPISHGGSTCENVNVSFTGPASGHTYGTMMVSYESAGTSADVIEIDDTGFTTINNGVNRKRVRQVSHGFTFGNVLAPLETGGFTLAYAGSKAEAEAIGVVSRVIDTNNFDLTFQGEVRGNFSGVVDFDSAGDTLSIGYAYFLSGRTAGNMTTSPPTESQVGFVKKPMMIALDGETGLVVNYIGGEIAEAIQTSSIAQGNKKLVAQPNHGLTVGDAIRFDAGITTADNPQGTYVKAQANNTVEAETFGIVTEVVGGVSSGSFWVTNTGWATIDGNQTFTPGNVYFLSANSASNNAYSLTTTVPETLGQVKKPMFVATGPKEGLILSYVGRVITPNQQSNDGELQNLLGKTFIPSGTVLPRIKRDNTNNLNLGFNIPGGGGDYTEFTNTDTSKTEKFAIFLGQSTSTPEDAYGRVAYTQDKQSPYRYNSDVEIPDGATHVLYKVTVDSNQYGDLSLVFSGEPNVNYPFNFETKDRLCGWLDGNVSEIIQEMGTSFTRCVPINKENPNGHIGVSFTKPLRGSGTEQLNLFVEVLGFFIDDASVLVPTTSGIGGSRNLLVNGNMDLWERGTTSFVPTTGIRYGADRWRSNIHKTSSSGTIDSIYSRGSFDASQTTVPGYPSYYIQFKGNITGTTGASDHCSLEQPIENARSLMGKYVTVSFYAKGSVAGRVRCRMTQNFQSISTNRSYHIGYADISDGWRKYVFTTSLGTIPTGGTFGSGSFLNFGIDTVSYANSSYSSLGTLVSTQFEDDISYPGIVSVAQVQVVEGRSAPDFQRPPISDEIERSQRFYCKTYEFGVSPGTAVGAAISPSFVEPSINDTASVMIPFPTKMRTTPSVTLYTPNGSGDSIFVGQARTMDPTFGGTLQNLDSTIPVQNIGASSYSINSITIPNTTPNFYDATVKYHYTADAEINTD